RRGEHRRVGREHGPRETGAHSKLIVEQREEALHMRLFHGPAVGALHEGAQQSLGVLRWIFRNYFHGDLPRAGETSASPAETTPALRRRRADLQHHTGLAIPEPLQREIPEEQPITRARRI